MIAFVMLTMLQGVAGPPGFDHARHARLFPSCASCHAGADAGGTGRSLWPAPASCASCHDGTVRPIVAWQARRVPRRSNLRFDHQTHAAAARTPVACAACHTEPGGPRMAVQGPIVGRCLECHAPGTRTAHLALPDSGCAQCHLPLVRAVTLSRRDIAGFPEPPSHRDPAWPTREGHGKVPAAAVAMSCATCHAREFCYQCHAGGAPPRAIAILASDVRSTAIAARRPPPSHGGNFADRHRNAATANTASCAGCHVRSDCLDCHRPAAASGPGYHPAGFLARHPAAAYARETSCNDCHSERAFCASCHAESGLGAGRGLRTSYHDAQPFFVAGHGGAARQHLESCTTCHTERDCLPCHSAQGGRRFNPHGPGFDAQRLRRKNFEMCTVCHGAAVPR